MAEREAVQFSGDRMRIRFDKFDISSYRLFLRCKALPEMEVEFHRESETYSILAPARFASLLGVQAPAAAVPRLPMSPKLYDDQSYLVRLSLAAKRFAIWSQCGNGKTLIGLEWARQVVALTGGRVLVVTFNEIVPEWEEQAFAFYGEKLTTLPILRLRTREEMRTWCEVGAPGIAVVNYEKFNPGELAEQTVNECRHLAGVVLDESSRLKGGGGKQKWALIKSMKGVEYKLSLTATPAPNDIMEFASQASFLEKMRTETDIIWTFFTRDPETQEWTVKPHARKAFFEWMSSWSIYVNNPKRYGWRKGQPDVPAPVYHTVEVPMTPAQRKALEALNVKKAGGAGQIDLFGDSDNGIANRSKLSQIAKGFRYQKGAEGRTVDRIPSLKPKAIAKLLKEELRKHTQVLIWTVFEEELEILREALSDFDICWIDGGTTEDQRVNLLEMFRRGDIRVLISRARMLGYGKNFQHCGAMIFSGWTDSFEDFYQAVRRAVRHGQKQSVRVYLPLVRELEGDVLDNIRRKEADFERSIAEMEDAYIAARQRLGGVA